MPCGFSPWRFPKPPYRSRAASPRLVLVGLVGIRDEVRPEARSAISQVHQAGIQVVMMTGDNRETAAAIARSAGLLEANSPAEAVMTSSELENLTNGEVKARLPALRVVARAMPADKAASSAWPRRWAWWPA